MYSPKISEVLIPVFYREAKRQGVPMTTLVNRILANKAKKFLKGEQNERNDVTLRREFRNERTA